MSDVETFVIEAELELSPGLDPASIGAAVTTELCGHWEHDGPCRWPHDSAVDPTRSSALFRTLYVAAATEAPEIHDRIAGVLEAGSDWSLVSICSRPVAEWERALAERLRVGPRAIATPDS